MESSKRLTEFLRAYVSEHKQTLIEEVLHQRTRQVTVVLENIYHSHNASAVVRSCDCFGVQDLYVIEGHNEYQVNPYVVRGSAKWVSIYKYPQTQNSENCFETLKSKGYSLIGTSPDPKFTAINNIDLTSKVALVFGTEETGLSDFASTQMDSFAHIPMVGFTESLNISVSVAICLYEVAKQLREKASNFHLSKQEKDELRLDWYKKVIARSDVLEREFLRIKNN